MSEEFDAIDAVDSIIELVEEQDCVISLGRLDNQFYANVDSATIFAVGKSDTLKGALIIAIDKANRQVGGAITAKPSTTPPRETSSGMGN